MLCRLMLACRFPPRAARVLATLVAVLCLSGISCGKGAPGADGGTGVSVLEPVPAPAGLVAELFVRAPEATWTKVRALVAGPAAFLPQTFGGLAVTLLGLPIGVASEFDAAVPALGAVVAPTETAPDGGAPAKPRGTLGLHVKDGARLLDQLTKGEAPRFVIRQHAASSMAILDAKDGKKGPTTMGVIGNYLLIAQTEPDLVDIGPYVARTMPRAPVPAEEIALLVPETAMDGPVRAWIGRAREGLAREQGANAGFAQLMAPLSGALDVLADLRRGKVSATLDETAVRVHATLLARAQGPARQYLETMTVGDLAPLTTLPADTLAAMLVRESASARAASATRQSEGLALLLGRDVPAKEKEAMSSALGALAEGRGDWMTAGLSFGPTGPAGYFRAPVIDEAKLRKGLGGLVALGKQGPVKDLLGDFGVRLSTGKTKIDGLPGEVERVRFERVTKPGGAKPAQGLPDAVELLYAPGKEAVLVAAGLDAKGALTRLAATGQTLGQSALVKAALDRVGSGAAIAIVLEPLLFVASRAGRPGAGESAPAVMTFGREDTPDGAALAARFDVANAAVREGIKNRGAFLNP
jgi:hypothetical protein